MKKEKHRILLMAALLGICCFLTYYFHVVLGVGTAFTHFFYVPIVLASLWWRRKGLVVAMFLASLLIFSHFFIRLHVETVSDLIRAPMFIAVALVVSILSERIAKTEELENVVEKRTKDLAKERDYTRHLIESSPDFQMTLNKDGRIMDVNKAFEHIVGKSREDLIGTSIYQYLPKVETEKAIAQIFEKEKVRNIELTADIPGKGTFICNFSGTVFTTPEGELGIYATGRDIAEHKGLEQQIRDYAVNLEKKVEERTAELRESEQKYRELFKGSVDAVISVDQYMKILLWNPGAERIFGYTEKEIIGQSLLKIVPERYRKAKEKGFERFIKAGLGPVIGKTLELEGLRKDGTEVPIELSVSARKAGEIYIATAIVRDITERKRMEQQIKDYAVDLEKKVEERTAELRLFSQSAESSIDGVAMGNLEGRITYANETFVRMFGYSREELIGQEIAFIYAEDPIPKLEEALKTTMEGGWTGELMGKRKNGELFLMLVSASRVLDDEGKVIAIMANHRDITERKWVEKEREALVKGVEETNRKLERSNRELLDFVYIASHDLREPMRKISAFGQLLQDSLKGKLDEDEQENFAFMIDGAIRMQRMIDDLLTYSRVTTKAKLAKRVDLNEGIEDLKRIELAVLLEETGGTIHVPEPLLAVQADPSQVHQLLQNLIANGLKFHREGILPEITVRSRRVNDNLVRVEVEDNGIGIDEENYEKIFGMFQRLYSREDYKGTGIGLAVCKKIVERHGGNIGVNSTPNMGSTFWFTLSTITNGKLGITNDKLGVRIEN